MKIYDITVTGATADWLTYARGDMPLPVFLRRLLTEIAKAPEDHIDLINGIFNTSVEDRCTTRQQTT
ncbi:hypothetical protein [Citrobacter amalonaticus]|uniref:hypothetical protein n=1 Tax=Citrobacter amalonaticus TaxID=35703 RepID=UPI0022529F80|nr:hypothetical protein [Citrobacter amalonaticus]MCX3395706.1 hypothetical protein [Citrobacter amalonaticus]MDQ2175352.1 hypothetical protein [Citrobacter amalonaticus]HEM6884064.1 hypothetical protein [Citrobacter amalonaticus]